jgi:hypothetical protein
MIMIKVAPQVMIDANTASRASFVRFYRLEPRNSSLEGLRETSLAFQRAHFYG